MTNPTPASALDQDRWYTRPVFFVTDIHRAAQYSIEQLGFTKQWPTDNDAATVCQVHRGECEIILCEAESRVGTGRLFIELTAVALATLRQELASRHVPMADTWWGYDSLQLLDPDGNELLFPEPGYALRLTATAIDRPPETAPVRTGACRALA